jgi:hypothetical protein
MPMPPPAPPACPTAGGAQDPPDPLHGQAAPVPPCPPDQRGRGEPQRGGGDCCVCLGALGAAAAAAAPQCRACRRAMGHPACVEPWLGRHRTCPLCRARDPVPAATARGGGGRGLPGWGPSLRAESGSGRSEDAGARGGDGAMGPWAEAAASAASGVAGVVDATLEDVARLLG